MEPSKLVNMLKNPEFLKGLGSALESERVPLEDAYHRGHTHVREAQVPLSIKLGWLELKGDLNLAASEAKPYGITAQGRIAYEHLWM